jgi:hypothetical protein
VCKLWKREKIQNDVYRGVVDVYDGMKVGGTRVKVISLY